MKMEILSYFNWYFFDKIPSSPPQKKKELQSDLIRLTRSFFHIRYFWSTTNVAILSTLPVHVAASATYPIISAASIVWRYQKLNIVEFLFCLFFSTDSMQLTWTNRVTFQQQPFQSPPHFSYVQLNQAHDLFHIDYIVFDGQNLDSYT